MGLFGKTKDGLKLRQIELESKERGLEHELKLLNSQKDQLETERANHLKEVKRSGENISAENSKLEERRSKLALLEATAKTGFEVQFKADYEKKLEELEIEISKIRAKRLENVTKEEQAERERIQLEISKERETWSKEQDEARKRLSAERTELERQKGAADALQSELEGQKTELEAGERCLERKEELLELKWQKKNDALNDTLEEMIEEKRKTLEAENQTYKDSNEGLRESLRIQTELVCTFDHLKRLLGDSDPGKVIRDLDSKTDEIKRLQEELATRPTKEMREQCASLEEEARWQKERADNLKRQVEANYQTIMETADLKRKNYELDAENKSLEQRANLYKIQTELLQAELNRLQPNLNPEEVQSRYKEIEIPHIEIKRNEKNELDEKKKPKERDNDEIKWLEGIGNKCDNYGIHFNPRILKAFHTALKTAEWSPLTILAGVSGTGKSELPRLYSHFGGLYFEPLSVQPIWDSQESMLGFFNSIDNKFDAQPVLRFLAQSQKPWGEKSEDYPDGYPGLKDAVCMVLLDEMNLAHPELYFAEFLSKLELRRGMKGTEVPWLPVKTGAGIPPYKLPLGRNVLWTGTMNQDETTKSLSDKVLDRSIIIYFPRPTELKRRRKLEPLDDNNRGETLHKKDREKWLAQGTLFEDDEIKPFKEFLEDMNVTLAVTGRAIGHRVFQSVEYYMANYPDVRVVKKDKADGKYDNDDKYKAKLADAMQIAFEDQLVQKVMPKLRGIDTRGKSKTKCLDIILEKLNKGIDKPFNLAEDFNLAMELGHGQFIWQSANYLKDDSSPGKTEPEAPKKEQAKETHSKKDGE